MDENWETKVHKKEENKLHNTYWDNIYRNKRRLFVLIISLYFLLPLLWPYKELECSKSQDCCRIYRTMLLKKELKDSFKLSDIERCDIDYKRSIRRYDYRKWYRFNISLTGRRYLYITTNAHSREKAEEMWQNLLTQENYTIITRELHFNKFDN